MKISPKTLLILIMIGVFSRSEKIFSCDDTILNFFVADNPSDLFCKNVLDLNSSLSALGSALNNQSSGQYDKLLQELMGKWVGFSAQYTINPPELVKNDENWFAKMKEIGERIGRIRQLISENDVKQAHQEVLDLSGFLVKLFESVEISEVKKTFLRGTELLAAMESAASSQKYPQVRASLASFSQLLATFTPLISSASQVFFETLSKNLKDIETCLETASGPSQQLLLHIDESSRTFSNLRARILAQEWFPQINIPLNSSSTGVEK